MKATPLHNQDQKENFQNCIERISQNVRLIQGKSIRYFGYKIAPIKDHGEWNLLPETTHTHTHPI